jgi:hypothetical protein
MGSQGSPERTLRKKISRNGFCNPLKRNLVVINPDARNGSTFLAAAVPEIGIVCD